MQAFWKLLLAAVVGATWYHFGGEDAAMALVFFSSSWECYL